MSIDVDRLTAALSERYTLEHELGSGGMAVVYQAEDIRHGRKVAIKVLRPDLAATLGAERFLQEVRTTARLHHANILTLIDSGEADGFIYYVLPLVDGESLRDRLAREKQLPVEDAVAIAAEVADALAYAHKAGVVHRDVKPDNIMLSAGHAALMDFGVATGASAAGGDRLTQTGVSIGSPTYMSPEQADPNTQVDGRSDIYSLGCTLYEMLAGHPPFTGSTTQSILVRKSVEDPPSIRVVRPAVPDAVEQTVFRSLERSPADRYRTAADFKHALQAAAHEPAPDRTAPSEPATRTSSRGWTRFAWVAAGIVTLVGVGWWALRPPIVAGTEIRSIAILPLANLTGDTMDQAFVEAIHADLIHSLQQISSLTVKGRRSVMVFQDSNLSLSDLADRLGVDAVIEGEVFGTDTAVRIALSLVDAQEEKQLWGKNYREEVSNLRNLDSRVVLEIAREIRATTTAEEEERLRRHRPVNPDAFEAYAFGIRHLRQQNPADINAAITYLEQAISLEPENAQYHAALAQAFHMAGTAHGDMGRQEAGARAKEAALRAIDLDESLADGHTALGLILTDYEQDAEGAEQAFRRALAINPNSATAHWGLGLLLAQKFRLEEALSELLLAQKLEPLTAVFSADLAVQLYFLRRHDEALLNAERAVALDPELGPALWILGEIYLARGMHEEAISAMEHAAEINPAFSIFLMHVYSKTGRRADAVEMFASMEQALRGAGDDTGATYGLGLAYAILGPADSALAWLERAQEQGNPYLASIRFMPHFDSIREDPRFIAILARLDAAAGAN